MPSLSTAAALILRVQRIKGISPRTTHDFSRNPPRAESRAGPGRRCYSAHGS